jgi:hypothetical protein
MSQIYLLALDFSLFSGDAVGLFRGHCCCRRSRRPPAVWRLEQGGRCRRGQVQGPVNSSCTSGLADERTSRVSCHWARSHGAI